MRIPWLALLLFRAWNGSADSEPQNVFIEGYTFTRPTNWVWRASENGSAAMARFVVPGTNGGERTDVRFYSFAEDLRQRMISNFQKGSDVKDVPVKVGNLELSYVIVTGTTVARPKEKAKPGYRLVGVVLKSREKDSSKQFLSRLYGPREEVDAATKDFKQMIEKAVEATE